MHADLRHIWVFTHSVQWEVGGGAEGAEQREVPVGNGRWVARGGGCRVGGVEGEVAGSERVGGLADFFWGLF